MRFPGRGRSALRQLALRWKEKGDAARPLFPRDRREQGRGLGKAILKDAILRMMQTAEIAGLKLLLVHAKDEAAADFYRKRGFEPVLGDPLQLFLPVPLSA
jgi:GNAT superfamily N-acetyltransferase